MSTNRKWERIGINSNENKATIKSEPSQNHCRICLKSGNVSIFGSNITEDLSDILQYFAGIEIEEDDGLSKHICSSCFCFLKSCERFRNTAQENDRLMKDQTRLQLTEEDFDNKTDSKQEYEIIEDIILNEDIYSDNPSKYFCMRCSKGFNTREEHLAHTKTTEHKNFKAECPICKGLYRPLYLKDHIAWHRLSNEESFVCDICGKSFPKNFALNRHRATHGLDLPYKCDLCPYRGRFKDSLKLHKRTHTGYKPYKCDECPAKFVNRSNLNRHSYKHRTEFLYKCESCDRGFNVKKDMEIHFKNIHSGIKDQICETCGKAFGHRRQMMKHQLKVHKRQKLMRGKVPLYIQADQLKEKLITEEQDSEVLLGI